MCVLSGSVGGKNRGKWASVRWEGGDSLGRRRDREVRGISACMDALRQMCELYHPGY